MAFPEIVCTPSCRSCLLMLNGNSTFLSDLVPSGVGVSKYYFNVKVREFSGHTLEINFRFQINSYLRYPVYFFAYPLFSNSVYFVDFSFTAITSSHVEIILYNSGTTFMTKKVTSQDKFTEWGEMDRIDKHHNAVETFKYFTKDFNYSREAASCVVAMFDCFGDLNPAHNLVPKRMIPDENTNAINGMPKYGYISAINYGYYGYPTTLGDSTIDCGRYTTYISPQYQYILPSQTEERSLWQIIYDEIPVPQPEPLPDDYFYDNGVGLMSFMHRTYAQFGAYPQCYGVDHTKPYGTIDHNLGYKTFLEQVFTDDFMTLKEQLPRMRELIQHYIPDFSDWYKSRKNPKQLVLALFDNEYIENYIALLENYNYKRCLQTKVCYWYQQLAHVKCKDSPFWVYLKWQYP